MIVACDRSGGIGLSNQLPWRLPGDLKYFREITVGANSNKRNAVIMGRNTWQSIPSQHKPLANRLNIVLTSSRDYQLPAGVPRADSLDTALEIAKEKSAFEIFLIGGSHIYREGIAHPCCRRIYMTQILASFDCDVFFPIYKDRFELISQSEPRTENGIAYRWELYERAP